MKPTWPVIIIFISFLLMWVIKSEETCHLSSYFRTEKTLRLSNFNKQKIGLTESQLEALELWESMLTGRSAPLSKMLKDKYKKLGLNHLFTPSGFHLSAVMLPFTKLIQNKKWQLLFILIIGLAIFALPGMGALKRMVLVKANQNILGQRSGFILALCLDILFGSFSNSPLSFCYSFLFLGIIYSGVNFLFLWFFFGQCLIAFFNGLLISPLIIILSPLLNFFFALAMPLLFVLAIPLWSWQLQIGLKIIMILQKLVDFSVSLSGLVPSWEINLWILIMFCLFYLAKRKFLLVCLVFLTQNLNRSGVSPFRLNNYEFVPMGRIIKKVVTNNEELVYWSDGKCRRELISGLWWEKCSPRRKSTHKFFKKLSSL
jgi:hypothetical protein